MSDTQNDLNMRDVLARIDRQLAESAKLREETNKFVAEQHKLNAEAEKLTRDRWLAPVVTIASVIAAVGASFAAFGTLLRLSGHG